MHETGVRLGGRYRLDERLGAGGMGEVWRATDELLGRTVAVKLILPALTGEPGFGHRFLAEARAMAGVGHPGVAALHDYRSDATGAFLVMEYVEGEALSRILARLGRLDAATAMTMVGQVADALQAVHDRGIVHRDVKPANLLVRPDGTVVLADFGIARAHADTARTTAGVILGTPSYLAPEQVLGRPASPRSDVYALGVVAYECLAGRRPFDGDNPFAVAMQRVRQRPPELPAAVPQPVRRVVGRALATDPAQRPSAADLALAARQALAPTTLGGPTTPRRQRRRRWGWVAVVTAVAVGLVGAGLVSTRLWDAGPASPDRATPEPAGATTAPQPGPADGPVPAGFVSCGTAFCPAVAMCWGGLVVVSGVAHPPRRVDCEKPHYWETFAAGYLPPAVAATPQDELMSHGDIAALCSEQALAAAGGDPASTGDWRREAWPVQAPEATWLLHCLASPGEGESTGSVFG